LIEGRAREAEAHHLLRRRRQQLPVLREVEVLEEGLSIAPQVAQHMHGVHVEQHHA
jgi:hypothetical protein